MGKPLNSFPDNNLQVTPEAQNPDNPQTWFGWCWERTDQQGVAGAAACKERFKQTPTAAGVSTDTKHLCGKTHLLQQTWPGCEAPSVF